MTSITKLISNIELYIINPLVMLLFAAATLVFFWGVAQFILNAGNEEERTKGKQHMLWGVIGMFIMFSAYGIIRVLTP